MIIYDYCETSKHSKTLVGGVVGDKVGLHLESIKLRDTVELQLKQVQHAQNKVSNNLCAFIVAVDRFGLKNAQILTP